MKLFIYFNLSSIHVSDTESVVSAVTFTLSDEEVDWDTAKSRCEALGQRLAVLDTEEKLTAFARTSVRC